MMVEAFFFRMKNTVLISISILTLSLYGCYKEKAAASDCEIITVSYSEDIVPIIKSSCKTPNGEFGCHEDWIDNYSQIKPKIKNGVWQQRVFDLKDMPDVPNNFGIDSLNADEFFVKKCWVEQGFRNN